MSQDFGTAILLVEDNEDDVFVMERALRRARINNPLRIVTDGQQAVDSLSGIGKYDRQSHPLPFIVFLDLKLPYVDGFEVLNWMRLQPQLRSVVVVILTSSAEERDHQRAYALGARSYLVKPPTPQMVQDVFDSLKSYWLAKSASLPVLKEPASCCEI